MDKTGNFKKPLYNETHGDKYFGGKNKSRKKCGDYRSEFSMIRECLSDAVIFEQGFEEDKEVSLVCYLKKVYSRLKKIFLLIYLRERKRMFASGGGG